MARYYLSLALGSLRRTPWLSLLMIVSLAVGIAASMTTITLRYVLGLDPVPDRSERLLNLHDGATSAPAGGMFSYSDARMLERLAGSQADAVLSAAGLTTVLFAAGHQALANQGVGIRYATRGFFRIFGVPLKRGRIWTLEEERSAAPVIVLEESTAKDLFKGGDALGKQVVLGNTQYTVIGLTDRWNPQPRYYDLDGTAGAFGGGGDAIFLPVTSMRYAPDNLMVNTACPGESGAPANPSRLLSSQCRWLHVWYLAHTHADVQALRRAAVDQLPAILPPNLARDIHLSDVRQILADADVVPGPVKLYTMLGVAFLVLCTVNASGMQLSRVLRSSSQIGIRRALGASRSAIITQYLCDALLVCSIGGALGMALTFAGLAAIRHLPGVYYGSLVRMDGSMFALMLALVVLSGTLVGVIPAWLASRADPALLIKVPQ